MAVGGVDEDDSQCGWNAGRHREEVSQTVSVTQSVETNVREGGFT